MVEKGSVEKVTIGTSKIYITSKRCKEGGDQSEHSGFSVEQCVF